MKTDMYKFVTNKKYRDEIHAKVLKIYKTAARGYGVSLKVGPTPWRDQEPYGDNTIVFVFGRCAVDNETKMPHPEIRIKNSKALHVLVPRMSGSGIGSVKYSIEKFVLRFDLNMLDEPMESVTKSVKTLLDYFFNNKRQL